ncbi:unnamed protein product [Symbiodinium sp. CCMP2592]|nr:unnamed protein product [Symbiodinium sp. CCMP2592]
MSERAARLGETMTSSSGLELCSDVEALNQRLTELRQEVNMMKTEQQYATNRLKFLQLWAMMVSVAGVLALVKVTNSNSQSRMVSTAAVAGVNALPPYYFMSLGCVVGSTVELFILGPPSMRKKERHWTVQLARTAFQLYLLVSFVYNAYVDVSKTVEFAEQEFKLEPKKAVAALNIVQALFLHVATGRNVDDAVKNYALLALTLCNLNFIRGHDREVFRDQSWLEQNRSEARDLLIEANGPIFHAWFVLSTPYVYVCMAMAGCAVLPMLAIYAWVAFPIAALFLVLVVMVIKIVTFAKGNPHPDPEYKEIEETYVMPLEESEENFSHMQFIGSLVPGLGKWGWSRYHYERSVFESTKVCFSAFRYYLFMTLVCEVAASFFLTVAIRLLNTGDYMGALLETAGERHWYSYLETMQQSALRWRDFIWRVL